MDKLIVLNKFKQYLELRNYAENTIVVYYKMLEKYLIYHLDISPTNLSQSDLEEFLYNYKFTSITQQNQFYSALTIFYIEILNSKLTKVNLKRPRTERRLPKIINTEFLLDKISKINNLKHKAIISLAYSTGLRVSEIINLKIDDIDSVNMLITIRNSKFNKDRYVPLSKNILILLRQYFLAFRPKLYLFNGQGNALRYSSSSCNQIVKKYINKKYHFHMLRHSCATNLIENNVDIRIIQVLLGHASSKTTEIYTHVSTKILNKIPLPI